MNGSRGLLVEPVYTSHATRHLCGRTCIFDTHDTYKTLANLPACCCLSNNKHGDDNISSTMGAVLPNNSQVPLKPTCKYDSPYMSAKLLPFTRRPGRGADTSFPQAGWDRNRPLNPDDYTIVR